eukprot:647948-Rhodomonas_salina.2
MRVLRTGAMLLPGLGGVMEYCVAADLYYLVVPAQRGQYKPASTETGLWWYQVSSRRSGLKREGSGTLSGNFRVEGVTRQGSSPYRATRRYGMSGTEIAHAATRQRQYAGAGVPHRVPPRL